jgi:hypothetical protein
MSGRRRCLAARAPRHERHEEEDTPEHEGEKQDHDYRGKHMHAGLAGDVMVDYLDPKDDPRSQP